MGIPEELMEALMTLHAEGVLSDYIYNVRDSEGEGWDGQRVKAFGDACNVMQWYVDKQFAAIAAEDAAPDKGVVFTLKDAPRSKVFLALMAEYLKVSSKEN